MCKIILSTIKKLPTKQRKQVIARANYIAADKAPKGIIGNELLLYYDDATWKEALKFVTGEE